MGYAGGVAGGVGVERVTVGLGYAWGGVLWQGVGCTVSQGC
jgi:hypothetical protein